MIKLSKYSILNKNIVSSIYDVCLYENVVILIFSILYIYIKYWKEIKF